MPKESKGYIFHAEFDRCYGEYALTILHRGQRDGKCALGCVEYHPHPEYEVCPPTLRLPESAMQALFDSLWDAGFRPRETVTPDALVAGRDAHISDLRQIVNKLLDTA